MTAVHNVIDLAQRAERFGYQRYWFAEHHLNPGVLGASPAVSISLVADATSTIRLGSAGVQLGHRQPLATVEEFGLLDAAYPGRLDLGLGRSFGRQKEKPEAEAAAAGGVAVHAYPGEGAALQVWILGASGGSSATVAGERGLRFAAGYHHSPSTVIDAVDAYRAAFVPSAELDRPHISVSADVVVGDSDEQAAVLASGYGLWVHGIRSGTGAITAITHDHADRVRSYELLAGEWARRGN
ncbi:hypothetical protein GCM10010435_22330 [Winogradskya consettensis]|uniref:Luciferase-like domain-containing protein n=1 Tax=Winogradskya consettensis TaxID=113560 RepID=A0A919W708_9ACTN|nr:hypothetical protein Aco04nite_95040 [Actinoplanes consettensis]